GEALAPEGQGRHVPDQEDRVQVALGRLGPGPPDGRLDEVDAGDAATQRGEEQGVLAGAAAGVQYRVADEVGHGHERELWPADLPGGRRPGVELLEGGAVHRVARHLITDGHGHDWFSDGSWVGTGRPGSPDRPRRSLRLLPPTGPRSTPCYTPM